MATNKTLIATLRELPVGRRKRFPLERATTIRNIIALRLQVERAQGAKWTTSTNTDEGVVVVTRTQ